MGLKRKASALELDAFTTYHQSQWLQNPSLSSSQRAHQPSSPPSLTSDSASPGSSPSSMDTEPFHSFPLHPEASYFTYAPNAPWLHTRTRKRVRDNRPSDAQIHDATMRRLFDAQRAPPHHHHHPTAMNDAPMMDDGDGVPMHFLDTEPAIMPQADGEDMELEEAMNGADTLGAPEANQRSIHDFFARQKGKQRECVPVGPMSVSVPESWGGPTLLLHQQQQEQPLKEKRSFGVLGDMNRGGVMAAPTVVEALPAAALLTPGVGSCLPCDFRPAEVVHALMEDAMVMG